MNHFIEVLYAPSFSRRKIVEPLVRRVDVQRPVYSEVVSGEFLNLVSDFPKSFDLPSVPNSPLDSGSNALYLFSLWSFTDFVVPKVLPHKSSDGEGEARA